MSDGSNGTAPALKAVQAAAAISKTPEFQGCARTHPDRECKECWGALGCGVRFGFGWAALHVSGTCERLAYISVTLGLVIKAFFFL